MVLTRISLTCVLFSVRVLALQGRSADYPFSLSRDEVHHKVYQLQRDYYKPKQAGNWESDFPPLLLLPGILNSHNLVVHVLEPKPKPGMIDSASVLVSLSSFPCHW